jgi:hypothetical protein
MSAPTADMPFSPEVAMRAVGHIRQNYAQVLGKYGFKCSFNASCRPPWFPDRFNDLYTMTRFSCLSHTKSVGCRHVTAPNLHCPTQGKGNMGIANLFFGLEMPISRLRNRSLLWSR